MYWGVDAHGRKRKGMAEIVAKGMGRAIAAATITGVSALFTLFSANLLAAPSSDERMAQIIMGLYEGSDAAMRLFPSDGHANGLAGFIKQNRLVFTNSEGSCSRVKPGVCQITAFITRSNYRKHRPDGAFCGAMVTWESPEKNLKKWTPTNGLANHIASNDSWALVMIDDKDKSYCR